MSSPPDHDRRAYKAGQKVPISGIYTAVHQDHREPHEVVAVQGEEFPSCRVCKQQVYFYITQLVPHMTADFDLTGPRPDVLRSRPRAKAAGKGKA